MSLPKRPGFLEQRTASDLSVKRNSQIVLQFEFEHSKMIAGTKVSDDRQREETVKNEYFTATPLHAVL